MRLAAVWIAVLAAQLLASPAAAQPLTPEDFGAVAGDGRDDTTAFEALVRAAAAEPAPRRIHVPAGATYELRRPIVPPDSSLVEVCGTLRRSAAAPVALAADVSPGDTVLLVATPGAFQPGDWIAWTDDRAERQSGASQSRPVAESGRVRSVDGRRVALVHPVTGPVRRAARGGVVGHVPSLVLVEDRVGVVLDGCGASGLLEYGWQRGLDAEPVDYSGRLRGDGLATEDTRAGSGVSILRSPGTVVRGLRVRGALLHNVVYRFSGGVELVGNDLRGAHDKNLLCMTSPAGRIEGNDAHEALFEDGIILYNRCPDTRISDNRVSNNARFGIHVGANSGGTSLSGNRLAGNHTNLSIRSDDVESRGDISEGGGAETRSVRRRGRGVLVEGNRVLLDGLRVEGARDGLAGLQVSGRDVHVRGGEFGRSWQPGSSAGRTVPALLVAPLSEEVPSRVLVEDATFVRGGRAIQVGTGAPSDARIGAVAVTGASFVGNREDLVVPKTGDPSLRSRVEVVDSFGLYASGLGASASPNPAADRTTVRFGLADRSSVRGAVIDALGRTVRTVRAVDLEPGEASVQVDLSGVAAGLYLIRIEAEPTEPGLGGPELRTARVAVVR